MYRAPDHSPRCPMCGQSNLTPPTRLLSGESQSGSDTRLSFDVRGPTDRFALEQASFILKRGSVCLDCGHVTLSLSAEDLAQLRARVSSLHPR